MNCFNCGVETTNPKYCSKRCSAIQTNKEGPRRCITRTCSVHYCNELVMNHRRVHCEHHWIEYQDSKGKKLDQTLGSLRERTKHLHKSSSHAAVRNYARVIHKDLLDKPCAHCGYEDHVELAHIKAVSTFPDTATIREVNSPENIIQLCPNCHWRMDHPKKV